MILDNEWVQQWLATTVTSILVELFKQPYFQEFMGNGINRHLPLGRMSNKVEKKTSEIKADPSQCDGTKDDQNDKYASGTGNNKS